MSSRSSSVLSDSSEGGVDDSLVDVENHIREIESYLQAGSDTAGAGLGSSGRGTTSLLALAGTAPPITQTSSSVVPSRRPAAGSQTTTKTTITTQHLTHTTMTSTSTPLSLTQTSSSLDSMRSSHHSNATPRTTNLNQSNSNSSSTHYSLSTPSTISSLHDSLSGSEDENQDYQHSSRQPSITASTPPSLMTTARSTASLRQEATSTSSDKDRLVKQLLQQHRQAQASAAAHSTSTHTLRPHILPVSTSTSASTKPQQPVSSNRSHSTAAASVATPGLSEREKRDALVKQLLEERRRQKEAEAPSVTTGKTIPSGLPSKSSKPSSYAALAAATYGSDRNRTQQTQSPSQQQQSQSYQPQASRSPLQRSNPNVSNVSIEDEQNHSLTSNQSSIYSPSHTAHSRDSSTNSPLDPRFIGSAQTIFDACDYINEDGTSIIHSNPPTFRSSHSHDESRERLDQSHERTRSSSRSPSSPRRGRTLASSSSTGFRPTRAQRLRTTQKQLKGEQQQKRSTSVKKTRGKSTSPTRPSTAGAKSSSLPPPPKRPSRLGTWKKQQRPTTTATAPKLNHIPGSSRYSKAAIIEEIERERAEQLTFVPKLISKPLLDDGATLQDRLEVWQQRLAANQARKLEQQKEYEEEKLAECTFAPKINKTSSTANSAHGGPGAYAWSSSMERDPIASSERLHHEADHRAIVREKAKKMNEEEQLESLPFKPQISEASRKVLEKKMAETGDPNLMKPIYERVAEIQKEKSEKLQALAIDARANADATFAPKINPVSEKLAREKEKKATKEREEEYYKLLEQTDANGAKGERFSQMSSTRALEKKMQTAHALQHELEKDYTFKPAMNPVSEQLLKTSRVFQGPNLDFLTRQQRLSEASREEQFERERALIAKDKNLTFKPDIGNADLILAQSKKRQMELAAQQGLPLPAAEETLSQSVERLSVKEAQELTLLKSKLKAAHDAKAGLTFRPEISQVSRILAEQRERHRAEHGQDESAARELAAAMLHEKLTKEFDAMYTFKPELNPTSQEMVNLGLVESHYSHRDMAKLQYQIHEDTQAKERKIQALAKEREEKELIGCTFTPEVHTTVPKPSKEPILIRGMNRFLQLKALKSKQEADQRARERKVFLIDAMEAPVTQDRTPYTIAKPFTLSHQQRAEERRQQLEKVRREAEEAKMKECSFAPVTKQAQNRQLIQQILAETDV